jgi:hypothetical protein
MKRLSVKLFDDSDIVYRGKIESGKLKDVLASLKDSVLRAYLRGQRTARELEQLSRGVYYQNISINNALMAANFDANIQNEVGGDRVVWRNFYSGYPVLIGATPDDDAVVDIVVEGEFGQAVLRQPVVTSKITVVEDNVGQKYAGPSLKIYTGDGAPSSPVTTEVTDRDDFIYTILDGDTKTFWLDDTSGHTQMALDILFPPSLTTKANVLTVRQFPFQMCGVSSASYKKLRSNSYATIPLPGDEFFAGLERAPIRLHFNPGDYGDEIRLILDPTIVGTGASTKYVYGLADVDVEYVEYASTGHMYDDLLIPEEEDGLTINQVTSFKAYYGVDSPSEETANQTTVPIKFQLLKTDGTLVWDSQVNGELTTTDTPLSGFSGETTIRVKTEMNNIGGVTPVLRGYRVTYNVS